MKESILVILLAALCCSCGAGSEAPAGTKAGEPLYLTDSLASQDTSPEQDTNRRQGDSNTTR